MRLFRDETPAAAPPAATPPAATPPAATAPEFLAGYPDDMRSNPSLLKFRDTENPAHEIAKAYLNASKMIGKPADALVELPADKTVAGLTPLLRQLGAPEDAKGYKLEAIKDAPAELGPDQPLSVALTKVAAQAGLLPEQTSMVYGGMVQVLQEAFKVQADQEAADLAAREKAVKDAWGPAFDQNKAKVSHVAKTLGIEEVLNGAGLGMHPAIAQALLKVESFMAEKPLNPVPGLPGQHAGLLPPNEARARALALQQQALKTENYAERKALNVEAQKYWQMANGGTPLPV